MAVIYPFIHLSLHPICSGGQLAHRGRTRKDSYQLGKACRCRLAGQPTVREQYWTATLQIPRSALPTVKDGLVVYPARFFWISSGVGLMHADWSEGEPTVHSGDESVESVKSITCPSVSCLSMDGSCQSPGPSVSDTLGNVRSPPWPNYPPFPAGLRRTSRELRSFQGSLSWWHALSDSIAMLLQV
ncbi:uncharacterized protein BO80DRAFT_90298 [Aspergillus ibericus CBS 121593]|uniref:Uncharacterized protein n=1 Tax=Aspergillus ibericus CBS 121593 TaxID=1448316 RepID=A0A395H103_9EURO|nr:hypothetical protein BO80DRAFT_90298 [Aspergillus ibericus CBS 121593]RAL00915.1 hypothetical protein BO80DRAFT_90298 [Aspergillus ibericus CBS 121593]